MERVKIEMKPEKNNRAAVSSKMTKIRERGGTEGKRTVNTAGMRHFTINSR
jgi:hypothetical protein